MLVAVALLIVMMIVMLVASAGTMLIVMMVMMVSVLLLKLLDSGIKGILLLHSGENVLAVKLVPRCSNNNSAGVVLSDKLYRSLNLLCLGGIGMRKHDAGRVGDLIVVELAKVLHIHLTLINVGNGGKAVKLRSLCVYRANCLDNVGELTYSAGLDNNSVGAELVKHLLKRLGEIANEGAADTAGIHLGDLNARVLKEAAVDTDLAKFVLDKNELFTGIRLLDKLLYKCSLAGSKEAGENIYFRHFKFLPAGKPPLFIL